MAFHFLFVFALLNIVSAENNGVVPEEVYWESVFPNNPMPKALKDILPTGTYDWSSKRRDNLPENDEFDDWSDDFSRNHQNKKPHKESKGKYDWSSRRSGNLPKNDEFDDWSDDFSGNHENKGQRNEFKGKYDEFDNWSDDFSGNNENKGQHNEFKGSSRRGDNRPKNDEFDDWSDDFSGNHENKGPLDESKGLSKESNAAKGKYDRGSERRDNSLDEFDDWSDDFSDNHENREQLKQTKIDETIFFFRQDLRSGKLVNLPNLITTDKTPFLQDRVAKSIPFSSNKLSEILHHFSLKPRTREANTVYKTIRGCERVAMSGEQRFCATSLESFVDSSISKLGRRIRLLSNELSKETKNPLFTIARGIQNMGENELVCHKKKYPGAVFSCHSINRTTLYKVPLVSKDGTKVNALAVCHKDTSAWNPKHMAFQILKIKPGTVPVCHFLFRDTLVWISDK